MIRYALISCLILSALCGTATADEFRVDVSQDVIVVNTGFDGASLTVFGAQQTAGDVVLVVEGPSKSFKVSEKGRRLGLWTNTDARTFPEVPTYYEVASTVPLTDVASAEVLREHNIGLENLVLRERRGADTARVNRYRQALIKDLQSKKLYVTGRHDITHTSTNLFKTEFALPAVVTPGRYGIYAYLFLDGRVIGHDQVRFEVRPEGLSADIKRASQDDRFLYGLVSVIMAMGAGWLATVLLKRD